jgi:hypothetical protein
MNLFHFEPIYRLLSNLVWTTYLPACEDGKYNVCRNFGQLPAFEAAHPRKPKFYDDDDDDDE